MNPEPFFTAEDFECDCPTEKSDKSAYEHLLKKDARKGHYDWCRACDGAWDANAKVAPLIAENERLKDANKHLQISLNRIEAAEMHHHALLWQIHCGQDKREELKEYFDSCEDGKSTVCMLTEQNRELESIVSKRVPKLEKILSIMKGALASYVRWCPFGCVEGDCGAEWDAEPKPCDACKPAREALQKVKALE